MASRAQRLIEPFRSDLVPVPVAQLGICRTCHSGCDPHFAQCPRCNAAGDAALDVLPIAMSINIGQFHRYLSGYKNDRSDEVRTRMSIRLSALLSEFLSHHSACVGGYDSVVGVPSYSRAAIDQILANVRAIEHDRRPALAASEQRTGRVVSPDRFTLTRDVDGERILLVDDTFTTGSSIFSAAQALKSGGAVVSCALVLGRHVNPTTWAPSADMLKWLQPRLWDETRCVRCDGEMERPGTLPL